MAADLLFVHNPLTGVPNKNYRGPQQIIEVMIAQAVLEQAAKCTKIRLLAISRSPMETTGVPNKNYRGPRQKLPGSPTKTTGVPNKNYRGPQQKLPGSPTSSQKIYPAKLQVFCSRRRFPVLLCFMLLLTTTGTEREEGNKS